MIIAFFDGLCEPINPGGTATYGYAIYRDGKSIKKGCREVISEITTNNIAEYSAVIRVLEFLNEENVSNEKIVIKGDSQLVVQQMSGTWSVNSPNIYPLYKKAKELLKELRRKNNSVSFQWIPREENKEADMLSWVAYKRASKGKT